MSAKELLDEEILEQLDFPVRCAVAIIYQVSIFGMEVPLTRPQRCPNPAVGISRCRVCGEKSPVCAEHRAIVASSPRIMCIACKAEAPGVQLFEFTPLAGG